MVPADAMAFKMSHGDVDVPAVEQVHGNAVGAEDFTAVLFEEPQDDVLGAVLWRRAHWLSGELEDPLDRHAGRAE
jgi:hypothetical protein